MQREWSETEFNSLVRVYRLDWPTGVLIVDLKEMDTPTGFIRCDDGMMPYWLPPGAGAVSAPEAPEKGVTAEQIGVTS